MATIVWNQFGPRANEAIRSRVEDVVVVDIPLEPEVTPTPEGAVLLAAPRRDVGRERLAYIETPWAASVDWVHSIAAGVDQFPPSLFAGRRVTATKGVWSIPVAEYVVTAILSNEKRVGTIFSGIAIEQFTLGLVRGKTVGIVGFGGIGQEIARRLLPFGVRLLATRRSDKPAEVEGVELTTIDRLFELSDHVVLALPTTERTRALVDERLLSHAKPGLHLINVARGVVIDDNALLAALEAGRIGSATLDVTEPEPLPKGHPLLLHPLVRVSPHVSGAAKGMQDVAIEYFAENLRRYLAGEPLNGRVDPVVGY